MPAPEMDKGNPVTVNVSMNASGKEHVADLLDMMKNAGLGGAEPVGAKMLSPRMDMERLSAMMSEPADGLDDREMDLPAAESYSAGDENAEGMVSNCCSAPVQDERNGTGRCSACGEGCEAVAEAVEETKEVVAEEELEEAIMVSAEGGEAAELLAILQNAGMPAPAMPTMPEPEMEMQDEYSNSPDEQEMDLDAVIASGDDLHREKNQFAAAADGDNPMKAFEGRLQSILDEMLAEDNDETTEEELEEAQSPAQKAAFEKMLAAKKGNKADDKDDDDEVEEAVEEAVAVNESADFSDMKHFMKRLNG